MPATRSVRRGSSRPANTSAADSASSLRATKVSASSDSASRWWASSTVQTSGVDLGRGGDEREHAHPDEEAVRWRAGLRPGRDAQRLLVELRQRRDVRRAGGA